MGLALLLLLRAYLANDDSNLDEQLRVLWDLIVITWSVHAINWAFCGGGLCWVLGIRPRQISSLPGIVCAHFLHGVRGNKEEKDNSHIAANTMAFATLGLFIVLQGVKLFWVVTTAVALTAGIGIWLLGRENTYHCGASGVVYGYIGFLLVYGLTSGNIVAIAISVIIYLLYGWAVAGILPGRPGISWEGHLFGFIGGLTIAYAISYAQLIYQPF